MSPHESIAADVSQRLTDKLDSVATWLLGEPNRALSNSRELRWGGKGSKSVDIRPGPHKGRWRDWEADVGGDLLDLVGHVYNTNIAEALRIARQWLGDDVSQPVRPRPVSVPTAKPAHGRDAERERNAAFAMQLWEQAVPLPGTLGETYLRQERGIDISRLRPLDHAMRWHAGVGAIIGLMTDAVTAEPTGGVQRIFVAPDATKLGRKMLGPKGVVRLTPDENVTLGLGVTEGIETGLAVMVSDWPEIWEPIWAALDKGGIAAFPVLGGIEELVIFADNDARPDRDENPGMEAAETCRLRWLAAGRAATVVPPPAEEGSHE